jgi:hypothetical protein
LINFSAFRLYFHLFSRTGNMYPGSREMKMGTTTYLFMPPILPPLGMIPIPEAWSM